MSGLIERKKAIDALDSINCCGWVEDSWEKVCSIIEHVPSAQPEIIKIIRCKDCKHWDGKKNGGFCEVWDKYISNDAFFCGSAERRIEDE